MDLHSELNLLAKAITRKFPNINYGGCCVFASLVASEMEKLGIPVCGIVVSEVASVSRSITEVRKHIQNNVVTDWEDNGVQFSHVAIEFKFDGETTWYDSNGCIPVKISYQNFRSVPVYQGRLTVQEITDLASNPEGWNDAFNRDNILKVRHLVRQYFADVTVLA